MSRELAVRIALQGAGVTEVVLGFLMLISTPICPQVFPGGACATAQRVLPVAGGVAILAGFVLLLATRVVPRRAS